MSKNSLCRWLNERRAAIEREQEVRWALIALSANQLAANNHNPQKKARVHYPRKRRRSSTQILHSHAIIQTD